MKNSNTVSLIGWYGGDKAIARAAWQSTQTDIDLKSEEEIRDLIVNTLWNNGSGKAHKTPFERGIVEFSVTLCQPSHIHCLKHRLANINGESARYKELKEDKFYLPEDWGLHTETNTGILNKYNVYDWKTLLEQKTEEMNFLYHECLKDLTPVLGRKRAKESARYFKTMNSQITLSIMMNMSCFHNFYSLRADGAAQLEIQNIANQMLELIKNIEGNPFANTLEAWKL
jgi:flavin-dependent thymidylate synthase